MREIQRKIISDLCVKHTIQPDYEIEFRVNFLQEYLEKSGAEGFVLGISGGQDSTLAGKLAQLAVDRLNSELINYPDNDSKKYKFIAVRLPYVNQKDEKDARDALDFINPDIVIEYDIFKPVFEFAGEYALSTKEKLTDFHKGNVKARMRMMVQYAIAGMNNMLVIGTDHAAEAITGFFTKFGDGACDLTPLTGLTKRQGKELLKYLNCPEHLYMKEPTADLLDNIPQRPDEAELGLTYDVIDSYLEGKEISLDAQIRLGNIYLKTMHKRRLPVTPFDKI